MEQNSQSKGARRVKQELIQRGIKLSEAEEVSEQERDFSLDNATRLAERYMRGKDCDIKTIVKLQRYLVSRGYDFDIVNSVVRAYKDKLAVDEQDDYLDWLLLKTVNFRNKILKTIV